MRLAFVGNPASEHIARWVGEFRSRGHQCNLYAPAATVGARIDYTPIGVAGLGGFMGFGARLVHLRVLLRHFQPDVVHGHFALNFGTWAALSAPVPVVVTCWGSDLFLHASHSPLDSWKVRTALRRADIVTVNSESLRAAALSLGAPADKVRKVVLGINASEFATDRGQSAHAAVPLVISTRRLEPLYRPHDLLEAASILCAKGLEFRLVVSGIGSLKERLVEASADMGLQDIVEFPGYLGRADLLRLYKQADVFVSVPESDSAPVSLFEAMAAQTAVVVSDVTAIREWVSEEAGNAIVPVGDKRALADAIESLIRDSERRKRAGMANREVALREADWEAEMDRMEAIYRELAGAS